MKKLMMLTMAVLAAGILFTEVSEAQVGATPHKGTASTQTASGSGTQGTVAIKHKGVTTAAVAKKKKAKKHKKAKKTTRAKASSAK